MSNPVLGSDQRGNEPPDEARDRKKKKRQRVAYAIMTAVAVAMLVGALAGCATLPDAPRVVEVPVIVEPAEVAPPPARPQFVYPTKAQPRAEQARTLAVLVQTMRGYIDELEAYVRALAGGAQ